MTTLKTFMDGLREREMKKQKPCLIATPLHSLPELPWSCDILELSEAVLDWDPRTKEGREFKAKLLNLMDDATHTWIVKPEDGLCGFCHHPLERDYKYCPICGRNIWWKCPEEETHD